MRDYEILRSTDATWLFLRVVLIGWTAIGMCRFIAMFIGPDRHPVDGFLLLPKVLELIGLVGLMVGAITAFGANSRNTALTIGAGAMVLYVVLAPWFHLPVRRGSYLAALLAGIQHVWFPIALVVWKIASPGQSPEQSLLLRLGSPARLLFAAQGPGVAGMCLLGAALAGLIGLDPFGAGAAAILVLTAGGSFLSAFLSLAFIRSPHRNTAKELAICHAIYLVILFVTIAIMIATSKPRYIGPGGY